MRAEDTGRQKGKTHEGVGGRQSDYTVVTGTGWLRARRVAFNLPQKMD